MMQYLLVFFCPLLFFSSINCLLVFLSKKKFGEMMPLSMMGSVFVLYLGQFFFSTFRVSLVVLLIVALLGVVAFVLSTTKISRFNMARGNFLSWGLVAFLVIYIAFYIVNFRRTFYEWDELSHWGKMVKEMLRLDRFYSDAESHLSVHKDYPPFISILQMLWCKLSGGYSEMTVTLAQNVFAFSLVVPVLCEELDDNNRSNWRKVVTSILLFLISAMIVLNFDVRGYFNLIYTDFFIPFVFVYSIFLVFSKKVFSDWWYNLLEISALICLLLYKQIGIAFFMLSIFLIVCYFATKVFKVNRSSLCWLCLMVIIPLLVNLSWSRYIDKLGIVGQFDSSRISVHSILDILSGGGTEVQHQAFKLFVDYLFTYNVSKGTIPVYYVPASLLGIIILFGIFAFLSRKQKTVFAKKEYISIGATFFCGAVGYAFTLFVLYMFCFSENETLVLASIWRYFATYLISEYLILGVFIGFVASKFDYRLMSPSVLSVVFGLSLIFMDSSNLVCLSPQCFRGDALYEYREIGEKLQNNIEDGAKVSFISSDNFQYTTYVNYYIDNDIDVVSSYFSSIGISEFPDVDDEDSKRFWKKVREEIAEDDYVYVVDSSDVVDKNLKDLFLTNGIKDNSLYKVHVDSLGIELREVYYE